MIECLIINNSLVLAPKKYLKQAFEFFYIELINKKILNKKNIKQELTIVFVDIKQAKQMNLQFRKKDYATDILSFESMDPSSYGELIICSQVAKEQSIKHKLSYRDELVYLTLHGFLHLLGFEHENDEEEAKKMFDLQDKLFEKFFDLK